MYTFYNLKVITSKKHNFGSVGLFCKSLNSDQTRMARVSAWHGIVWLESRFGSGSFIF